MSVFTIPIIKSKIPQQVISESWDMRDKVLKSSVNLFCWKRPVDKVISNYLGQLIEQELEPIQFSTNINRLQEDIDQVRSQWDQEPMQAANLFWEDAFKLIRDFLSYAKDKSGTVHLKVVNHNACTKFHTDGYSLRLFTTYYGRGTEWLPEKATNRKGLGKSNDITIKDCTQIQRMEPFEVGILKGEIPNSKRQARGIVHRSPEIAELGEKRIILRVDI